MHSGKHVLEQENILSIIKPLSFPSKKLETKQISCLFLLNYTC